MSPEERNARVRAVVVKLEALAEKHSGDIFAGAMHHDAGRGRVPLVAAIGLALFDAYELGVTDGYSMVKK